LLSGLCGPFHFPPNFFRGFHDPSGEDLVEEDPDVGVGHVSKEGDVEEGESKRSWILTWRLK
jgi:hypothetical protein